MPNPPLQPIHRQGLGGMDAWTRHQHFIKNYVKFYNDIPPVPEKPTVTELDVLHENHRFLRSESDDQDMTWEKRIAKKYYDKLVKEYALVELKYYKEGRVAMRWRNQQEVMRGKGQFTCGNLRCDEAKGLQSWEVNFGYVEQGEKKNALVKIRLCEKCSYKLNYKSMYARAKPTQQENESTTSTSATVAAVVVTPSKQRSRSYSRDRVDNVESAESSRHHHHESSRRSKRKSRSHSRERESDVDLKESSHRRHHGRDYRESSKRRKSSSHRDEDEVDSKDTVKRTERSRSSYSSSSSHRDHKRSHSTGDCHDQRGDREGQRSHRRSKSGGAGESGRRSDAERRGANHDRVQDDARTSTKDNKLSDHHKGNNKHDAIHQDKKDRDNSAKEKQEQTAPLSSSSLQEFESFFKGLFE
ncbi:hypothetical protein BGX33_004192 [Mortierella sp. NVP41]|nr:hypothetical protein BGX33_004192 [Mortierella sp. NVP41]